MTEYTKNYKIPYPTIDDPIYNGHTAMKRLAEKVDSTMGGVKAQKGDRGPQGPQGPRGAQGPRGRDAEWVMDARTSIFSDPLLEGNGSTTLTKIGPLIIADIRMTLTITKTFDAAVHPTIKGVIPEGWRPRHPVGVALGWTFDYGDGLIYAVIYPRGYIDLRHASGTKGPSTYRSFVGSAMWIDPAVLG